MQNQRQENDYWKYMSVGSIGPDLYYYVSTVQSGWDMLMEGFVGGADLSCPLEQKVLQSAYKELTKNSGGNATKYKALIEAA